MKITSSSQFPILKPMFLALLLFMAQLAFSQTEGGSFTITKSDGEFTITDGSEDATELTIQGAIDYIKEQVDGSDVSIQFGDGTDEIDIGTERISFNNSNGSWGNITLSGKITSTNINWNGTIYISSGVSVESTVDIGTIIGYAIYNYGMLTISSGTVSGTYPVYNSGILNITGGTISAYYQAIYNQGGTVNISDGTISANNYAIYNEYGTANISGGTISANNNYAIYNEYNGTAKIIGGTISVASTGTSVYTIYNSSETSSIILGGSPDITGKIRAATGTLSVITEDDDVFAPSQVYTLELSIASSMVAVANGANYASNFVLENSSSGIDLKLVAEEDGVNLVLAVTNGYAVSPSGATYIITKGTGEFITVQQAIDYIKEQVGSEDVSIQFGNGSELDIGTESISFNNSNGSWGKITLSGKITSANTNYNGTISINNGVSVESTADIKTTRTYAIVNYGTLTISGGTVSANTGCYYIDDWGQNCYTGYAVLNVYGIVNITGGTISATNTSGNSSYAIYNEYYGRANITGGTISATGTNSYAIYSNYENNLITLGNSPTITGKIRIISGTLSVIAQGEENVFNPGSKTYTLELSLGNSMVTVENGANYLSNFELVENPNLETELNLVVEGNNLVLEIVNGYAVAANDLFFTITRGSGNNLASVQQAIDYIKEQANDSDVSIQFGDGTNELDIGTGSISFNNSNGSWGKITISGKITSANTNWNGTININSGVTLESTADIRTTEYLAIYSAGTVNITSGTISAANADSYAIYANYITLGGNPTITGKIRAISGTLSLIAEGSDIFAPGVNKYTLEFSSYLNGMVAVVNGANYISNFELVENPNLEIELSLAVEGSDLVLKVTNGYAVSFIDNIYKITKGTGEYITTEQAINYIREQADGADVSIQFGNGTDELDIGDENIRFDGWDGDWGKITLSGKLTSGDFDYVIYIGRGVSVESTADIVKTWADLYTVENNGTLTISGGTISKAVTGTNRYAIYNNGSITLSNSPTIIGAIKTQTENLNLITTGEKVFNPGNKTYSLDLDYYEEGAMAVKHGAAFVSNFILANDVWGLIANGEDLIMTIINGYTVAVNGLSFTITRGSGNKLTSVQQAIDYIKEQANGSDVSIQFGDGTKELDISYDIRFDGWDGDWGKITISGKLTSVSSTISIYSVSVEINADIRTAGYFGIYNSSGTLTISGGNISTTAPKTDYYYDNCLIYNYGSLVLSNSPSINGIIGTQTENFSVVTSGENIFAPGSKIYTLYFYNYEEDAIALKDGAAFASNFVLANDDWGLVTSGSDLVFAKSQPIEDKTAGATVATPTLDTKTETSITIKAVATPSNGQEVEYAISTSNDVTLLSGWQTSLIFTGLSEGTTYYIFARAKENDTHKAGTVSEALEVKTDEAKQFQKAIGAIVAAPTLDTKTETSITIKVVAATSNGQEVEYAISTSNDVALISGWQAGLTFTNLSANTTYYIFARAKENDGYLAGTVSAALVEETNLDNSQVIASSFNQSEFKAFVQSGVLQISGLIVGKQWSVYNANGALVHSGVARSANETLRLNANGIYFVKFNGQSLKVTSLK